LRRAKGAPVSAIEPVPGVPVAPSDDAAVWHLQGRITFDNVTAVYAAFADRPLPTRAIVDLSGLAHADSSALALLLALLRRGTRERTPLAIVAMPAALAAIARVYGIDELLAPAADAVAAS
jgi:phospholipid transport system transporter-binding protein